MPAMTEREKEILEMPLIVFDSYLSKMTEEDCKKYLKLRNSVNTDKRNHAIVAMNTVRNMIACGHGESTFALKLKALAHFFNQPDYFEELVEAGISKEEIAYTFGTTVEDVECQILLNQHVNQVLSQKTYIKK